jgi:glycosyltransferase involved in cell wall biosynthesis
LGAGVQKLCISLTGPSFTLSALAAGVLREQGYRGNPAVLKGIYDGPVPGPPAQVKRMPMIVYAGRHIPEKQLTLIPEAVAIARRDLPELQAMIFGDGPERPRVLKEVRGLRRGSKSIVRWVPRCACCCPRGGKVTDWW